MADNVLCYISDKPCRPDRHDAPNLNRMQLISPTEIAKQKVQAVQEYTLLAAHSVANLFRKPLYFADMVQQADLVGVGSLPIVVLTGFFTGGVLALQTANTLQRFGSITLIGQLVSTSMVEAAKRRVEKVLTNIGTNTLWRGKHRQSRSQNEISNQAVVPVRKYSTGLITATDQRPELELQQPETPRPRK